MAPQRTTTLDFIDSKSRPPQWPQRQPRRAPRCLEAAQRPRLASANAQSSTAPSLPTQCYCVSPLSASLPSLSESAPGSQKSQNWRLSPRLKATPQLPAGPCAAQPLVPSAQRSQVPGELGPGGRGSELRHYEDGHFEHAAGAVPPAAGDVVEVEPPRALAVGLAPLAFQQFEGALGLRLGRLHAIVGVPPNEHRLRSRT